jgi:membrane protein YqaA with SNARE-associated domain
MPAWLQTALALLALPEYGLTTVFLVSFLSATLLPLGSLPVVFGVLKIQPDLFWPCILAATAGNTLGGILNWWLGWSARHVTDRYTKSRAHVKALRWLERVGPKACLLAWTPILGDPLCAVAGWLRLPLVRCVGYMALGMFARYWLASAGLLQLFPGRLSWD